MIPFPSDSYFILHSQTVWVEDKRRRGRDPEERKSVWSEEGNRLLALLNEAFAELGAQLCAELDARMGASWADKYAKPSKQAS